MPASFPAHKVNASRFSRHWQFPENFDSDLK